MRAENFERLNGLNCTEYLIKGVAAHFNRDYELMFLGSWGFNADFNKTLTEQGFISEQVSNDWSYLNYFHGIKIERHIFQNYNTFEEFVRTQLRQDNPVMATVDLYWTPWATQNYLRINWGHTILITGENSAGWLCYDFFSTHENMMPFDHMEKCFRCVFSFCMGKEPCFNFDDCMKIIRLNIQKNLIDTDAFIKMNHLADIFAEGTCLKLLEHAPRLDDFQTCNLMEALNRLSQRRSQFAIALKYLAARFGDTYGLLSFAKQFDQCAASWKSVWGMLQKAYLTDKKSPICSRVGDRIKEISKKESEICCSFLGCSGDVTASLNEKYNDERHPTSQMQYIPISVYANHKAIGFEKAPNQASFQSGFIIADDLLHSGLIEADGTTLWQEFDNIACVGQRVAIKAECEAISILTCSEFSHQTETILVNSINENFELPFNVTSWTWSLPEFEQITAWEGFEGFSSGGDIRRYPLPRHIYAKRYELPKQIYVEDILLPYCPNIHVFGITIHYN